MIVKSYTEYYKKFKDEHKLWKLVQKDEWWKDNKETMEIKGEYINVLMPDYERNDAPIMVNHTLVKNSEYDILFNMLGQHVIDFCNEHDKKNIYCCIIKIRRIIDGIDDVYIPDVCVKKKLDGDYGWKIIDDPDFDEYKYMVCDILDRFLHLHKDMMPIDWDMFSFSLDCIDESCKEGHWICCSDGSMGFGNISEDMKTYTEYVCCL